MHERVRDLLPRKSACLGYVIFLKSEWAEAVVLYPDDSCCHLLFPWQLGSFRPMESRCYLLYYQIPKWKVQGKHGVPHAFTLFHTLSRNFRVSLGLKPRAASSPRLPEDILAPEPSPCPLPTHQDLLPCISGLSSLLRWEGQFYCGLTARQARFQFVHVCTGLQVGNCCLAAVSSLGQSSTPCMSHIPAHVNS